MTGQTENTPSASKGETRSDLPTAEQLKNYNNLGIQSCDHFMRTGKYRENNYDNPFSDNVDAATGCFITSNIKVDRGQLEAALTFHNLGTNFLESAATGIRLSSGDRSGAGTKTDTSKPVDNFNDLG